MSNTKRVGKKLLRFLEDIKLLPVTKVTSYSLKYNGPARAGLLLKWEKEREKKYRRGK